MTVSEAKELLKHHSYNHKDLESPKTEKGFLGMLRPFQGQLFEDNFHELVIILKVLKQEFRSDKLDRQIISSFWGICQLSKAWALDIDGMLRRNNLITNNQIEQLTIWVDCISNIIMLLLDGMDDEIAFESYKFYVDRNKINLP